MERDKVRGEVVQTAPNRSTHIHITISACTYSIMHNMQEPHTHKHAFTHTPKDCTLGCGHVVCMQCAKAMVVCPFCDQLISNRIRMYGT